MTAERDGSSWRIGDSADVAWIAAATESTATSYSHVPQGFAAYCRLDLPAREDRSFVSRRAIPPEAARRRVEIRKSDPALRAVGAPRRQTAHDVAVVRALRVGGASEPWWLGYLEYGRSADVVFPDAPRTHVHGRTYVLVEAGPEQALGWRSSEDWVWKGALPDLMFGADHTWMSLTEWDDRWSLIGGTAEVIRQIMDDDELKPRARTLVDPVYRANGLGQPEG